VRTRHSAALRARLVAALVTLVACGADPSSPRGVAERFLDAHYVQIDLPTALGFTAGVAKQKIEHEIGLTAGHEIDATTRTPHVRYRLLEEHRAGDDGAKTFLYEGRVAVEDADTFVRRWLVTVRPADGGWRVTNFQEFGE
jgi:hypothetical protein